MCDVEDEGTPGTKLSNPGRHIQANFEHKWFLHNCFDGKSPVLMSYANKDLCDYEYSTTVI